MRAVQTRIAGLLILEPRVFSDGRGSFFESFNRQVFRRLTGCEEDCVQENHSQSVRNVLRGLHYQIRQPQGKLVRVAAGEVFDVAVDLRQSSPTFGQWNGTLLSAENRRMSWVPQGFAHGFFVLSEFAEVLYKTTDYWAPEHERTILWSDPDLAIDWPLHGVAPILSKKDQAAGSFREAELFP